MDKVSTQIVKNHDIIAIEDLQAQHLVVGIDIAQQLHVARAVNFRGIIILGGN